LDRRVITLGSGHASPKDMFLKRQKGSYVVLFNRGPYFERPIGEGTAKRVAKDDPLYGPMQTLGVDEPMIARLFAERPRGMIERWLRITEAATKDKPTGFPGFKVSPAAFFVDGVLNERTPPDWMYQLEKIERQKVESAEAAKFKAVEVAIQDEYGRQRHEALKAFLATAAGRQLHQRAYEARLNFNKAHGDPQEIAHRNAIDEATEWVDGSDEFSFPKLAVWMLARQNVES
jgi:hypothetical protein